MTNLRLSEYCFIVSLLSTYASVYLMLMSIVERDALAWFVFGFSIFLLALSASISVTKR